MSEILLKEGVPEMKAYMRLYKSTGWKEPGYFGIERTREALKNCWLVVCAYSGNELIGSGRIISDGVIHALITEMFVLPEWQGKGVGRTVMRHLLKRCKEADIRKVQLFSAPGKAEFYHKLGFTGRESHSPGMDWNFDTGL
ncbi:MAG: hypothetical protein A2Y33_14940 [Spirochaetes bacterium GWF1_51_8]|nr:MAG: hypothetical protein A2Y33_14940 [Spirochaetes bacterium GWF1_51_8]